MEVTQAEVEATVETIAVAVEVVAVMVVTEPQRLSWE